MKYAEKTAAKKLKILKEKTINWCEKIKETLEEKETNVQLLEYNVILARSQNERICYTVEETPSIYSDECNDYNINYSEEIYLPTVIKFFEKHYFKVSFHCYELYHHGKGAFEVLDLFIKSASQY